MTGVFIKEKRGRFTHTYTHGGRPCETRGRDCSDAVINQGTPRIAG